MRDKGPPSLFLINRHTHRRIFRPGTDHGDRPRIQPGFFVHRHGGSYMSHSPLCGIIAPLFTFNMKTQHFSTTFSLLLSPSSGYLPGASVRLLAGSWRLLGAPRVLLGASGCLLGSPGRILASPGCPSGPLFVPSHPSWDSHSQTYGTAIVC